MVLRKEGMRLQSGFIWLRSSGGFLRIPLGCIKGGEFPEELRDHHKLKKDAAPRCQFVRVN
jgi:hypothetical protein